MVKQQQVPTLVGFRNYFEQLEAHLGALLVPIQPRATGPRQIVTAEALHADLARRAAIEVYRENKCLGMESPVRLFPTLDALGRLRFKAEDSKYHRPGLSGVLRIVGGGHAVDPRRPVN